MTIANAGNRVDRPQSPLRPTGDGERAIFRADWPDHTQLPDSDGEIVENLQEFPQAALLQDGIAPVLRAMHPDGRFVYGSNSGIYWDYTDPPLRGAISPDWFYVPDVNPRPPDGNRRRSYVMWKELSRPKVVMEFASGDGRKERDRTPHTGKFWVYEQAVQAQTYVIFENPPARMEVWTLEGGVYRPVPPNASGAYAVPELRAWLRFWEGEYCGWPDTYIRWCDERGN